MQVPPKNLVKFSMGAAGFVILLTVLDLATKIPFGRAVVMDALFAVSAGIVLYLAYGTLRELT